MTCRQELDEGMYRTQGGAAMRGKRFKRYADGILYIVGNGKTVFFEDDKIRELHDLIHEWEKNPKEIFNMRKQVPRP